MKFIFQIFFILSLVVLNSCSKDDNLTNPQQLDQKFYPLKVGNTWTYSTSNGDQTIRIDQTVTATNGKTAYHIDGDDDYTIGVRHLYYDDTKLYGFEQSTEDPELLFDESTIIQNTYEINVPAGTFTTYAFVKDWGNSSIYTHYYAKGIGLVKLVTPTETKN